MTRKKTTTRIHINKKGRGGGGGSRDQLPYLSEAERLSGDEGEEADVALRHVLTLNTENN